MAKIVIDCRMLGWTGIGRYTERLLTQLEKTDETNDYVILIQKQDWDLWSPRRPNFRKVEASIRMYSFSEQIKLLFLLYRLKPDLVHFTAQNRPLGYLRKHLTTIHDLTLLDYNTSRRAAWFYYLRMLAFRLDVWWTVHFSTRLLVPTEFGKQDILRRYRVKSKKIVVTNEAADKLSARPGSLKRFGLNDFILGGVGNAYPYKNLLLVIKAFSIVHAKLPDLKLVFVGPDDPFFERLKEQAASLGLADRVVFTGRVSDQELVALYQQAKFLVFPSLSEGFGLPGLEAMWADLPVLSSSASCMPEVYGPAAEYFDPTDAEKLADAILNLATNPKRRQELVKLGHAQINKYSWERMAAETLEVYNRLLKRSTSS